MSHCSIEDSLMEAGLRKTRDRHSILELFTQDRTWTAAQAHAVLPNLDLSTIYRNLQRLTQSNILSTAHVHEGEQHYERADKKHHDHLACNTCDTVECVPCPVPKLGTHHLELIGTCGACS